MNFCINKTQSEKSNCATNLLSKYAKFYEGDKVITVSFADDASCSGDNYRICVNEDHIDVYANTVVGFNCAAGYLLRNQHTHIQSTEIKMANDYRGVYFATHFFNYYHISPIEELYDYLENLALWGMNALWVWFDMHHYKSIQNDDAQEMIQRIRQMFIKAKELGMKTHMGHTSNEYYDGAPAHLLAQNSTESGKYFARPIGFYGKELCPSQLEGEKLLLSSFDELLTYFDDIGIDSVGLSPYDQGGCTCDACYPWGGNGHFKISKKKAEIAKQHFPDAEIVFSTWRFGAFSNADWPSVLQSIQNDSDWFDYLLIDIFFPQPPEFSNVTKSVIWFPDISMGYHTPWGGFGANPYPKAVKEQLESAHPLCHGGSMYSEGLFEDINKITALELMRDPNLTPKEIAKEYCSFYFVPEYADALADIILRLEVTSARKTITAEGVHCDCPSEKPTALPTFVITNPEDVENIARDMIAIDKQMPDEIKATWRYQQIYLRALGDWELVKNNGLPNEKTDEIYEKLVDMYYAQNAVYVCSPITRESIMENRGGGL